ncbi:MAG: bile acid:sodium symporter family protein [Gammaproteobacteria bacterium]|nr:bile acid:sodium symporter family protein [Rhodocyclaceae bacterium]MBU3909143.1 bile acid:sodium symporter family protein [Gammaproteobacteria bacterium]MBU3988348.1 bile acid:sodium symporter family protein [Gammaproteobacteria bacterium]MBU4005697.1 bile acid:sodium symporter family protein [Gammaproteobacteria bacterium]MBU4020750.1 bile acid:sodium symporter family protein [Gammaproteobacteria bacterium]
MNLPVIELLLPLALAFIMFSLGLTLVVNDFRRVLARPKAMLIGLVGQMLLVPALAYVVVLVWGLAPEMAVGMMILAACPGGVSSGLLTYLARGDTALSISLTAVTSIAAVITVPFIVDFALQQFMHTGMSGDFPLLKMVRGVFLLTTVPVVLGMSVKAWRPALAARFERAAGRLATILFVLIVLATFFSQRQVLIDNLGSIGPAAMLLNLLVIAAGFAMAVAAGLRQRDQIAIATECGLQNAALGIFIASSVLQSPAMTVPSVVYALLMNVGALGIVILMRGIASNANSKCVNPASR